MQPEIKRYQVKHPLLKNHIRFFWELQAEHMFLDHKLIPQRDINLRINLSETPQYLSIKGENNLLENVYFPGLQDHFRDLSLKMNGKVHMLGICFNPYGLYPFIRIPLSEFRNQMLGACEAGFRVFSSLGEQLRIAENTQKRLIILEDELAKILIRNNETPDKFVQIFNTLKYCDTSVQFSEFCSKNNMNIRSLERMYRKYVGLSASTFGTLNRFHNSLNFLLSSDYVKLSDLAYDNRYFDQMHFIHDFKRFAGTTPKKFLDQKKSILQIGKIS